VGAGSDEMARLWMMDGLVVWLVGWCGRGGTSSEARKRMRVGSRCHAHQEEQQLRESAISLSTSTTTTQPHTPRAVVVGCCCCSAWHCCKPI